MRAREYILSAFNSLFFPLFFTLFFIASIILFVKVAGLSSAVKMELGDLMLLYLYSLPLVLFFVIPLCFFAAGVLSLNRLSYDNELILFFSLGNSPTFIYKIFLRYAILSSLMLLFVSMMLVPISKVLYKNFIDELYAKASLSIKSAQYGNKFGDFFVFVNDSDGKSFKDVVMYSKHGLEKESFMMAKSAHINQGDGHIEIALKDGRGYVEDNESRYFLNFEKLTLFDTREPEYEYFKGVFEYWLKADTDTKRAKDLSQSILFSLFPLLVLHLVLVFGIRHFRVQKNRSYYYILLASGLFYGLTYYVSITIPFVGTPLLVLGWGFACYKIYSNSVKARF